MHNTGKTTIVMVFLSAGEGTADKRVSGHTTVGNNQAG